MPNRRNFTTTIKGTGLLRSHVNPTGTTMTTSSAMHASRNGSDYSRRKPKGRWLPPTDYSMQEQRWKHANGSWRVDYSNGGYGTETGFLSQITSPTTLRNECDTREGIEANFPAGLSNRALTKARIQLKGGTFNAGVAYGERRETARFVGDTLGHMADTIDAIAYKDWRQLRKLWRLRGIKDSVEAIRSLGSQWLRYQYAIKPLMSDIYNACEALDARDSDAWKITIKASEKYKAKGTRQIYDISNNNCCTVDYNVFHGCYVRIDAIPNNMALRTATSLGLTNPLNIAWETTRLSFVVDWAYPLGDYFDQLDATLGWDIKGFTSSSFSRKMYRFKGLGGQWTSQGVKANKTASWSSEYRSAVLSRSSGTSVPFAMLPSIKDPFSKHHVLTGLALLQQVVAKWSR